MLIGRQSQGKVAAFHDHEGKTIGQAPAFIRPVRVQAHRRCGPLIEKRYNLDLWIMLAAFALSSNAARCRIRQGIHPLPQDGLGSD
jgi:hypothetical protein